MQMRCKCKIFIHHDVMKSPNWVYPRFAECPQFVHLITDVTPCSAVVTSSTTTTTNYYYYYYLLSNNNSNSSNSSM